MGIEIERKFHVLNADWQDGVTAVRTIRQGYLGKDDKATIRVRLVDGERAVLTIKGARADGVRPEFEYDLPLADAAELFLLCGDDIVEKRRHLVPAGPGLVWEIDVFEGRHAGLVIAEIELPGIDQPFDRPAWLGREVSDDSRYSNENIARLGVPD